MAAIALVGATPGIVGLGVVLDRLGVPAPMIKYFFFGGFAVMCTILIWHSYSRCPRCRRFFYMATIGYFPVISFPFARRCMNCNLSLQARLVLDESNLATFREWHRRMDGAGPLPDVGLRCQLCGYTLTGLTERRCPECAAPFDLEELLRE